MIYNKNIFYNHSNIQRASQKRYKSIMIGLISSIFIGLVVGIIAKLILPGPDPGGWIFTILIGLGGSVLAGYIGRLLGYYHDGHAAGFLTSILGAIALLACCRIFTHPKI
jgi:uncharacterized membrane protein YeaQ/YmgE (transglycosylase-associated protein family)